MVEDWFFRAISVEESPLSWGPSKTATKEEIVQGLAVDPSLPGWLFACGTQAVFGIGSCLMKRIEEMIMPLW
jgi:hypothetical protein